MYIIFRIKIFFFTKVVNYPYTEIEICGCIHFIYQYSKKINKKFIYINIIFLLYMSLFYLLDKNIEFFKKINFLKYN